MSKYFATLGHCQKKAKKFPRIQFRSIELAHFSLGITQCTYPTRIPQQVKVLELLQTGLLAGTLEQQL